MVAYKCKPDHDKLYTDQKQDYKRLYSPADTYNSLGLDRIARSYIPGNSYQNTKQPQPTSCEDDLLQPAWFEEIRKRLSNSEEKSSPEQKQPNKYHP